MKKINKETKVGLLTVATLAILIVGFNFLKGKDLFNKDVRIYAVFAQLGSLAKSNEVKINGLPIGTVYDLQPMDKNVSGIKVIITLKMDINIPTNSIAYIKDPFGGLGSANIVIEPGNSTTYLGDGDQVATRQDQGLLGGLSAEVSPTLSKIRNSLDSLNRVFGNINTLFDTDAKSNLQQTIANLNQATAALNGMLATNGALAGTLNNVSAITGNLNKNNDSITAILGNTKKFTNQLANLDLKQTMDTLQSAVSTLKSSMDKISSNEGTLGALINDRSLYNKLNSTVLSAEILMDDLRAHPKRYVNLSIFGKKDKGGALTSPSIKDTIPK
ncbi:MAG: MCE family protein [Chitinophagaceae bacterium]|nr:MAG: MCE family protein [Chitinophagaceae bacterium]